MLMVKECCRHSVFALAVGTTCWLAHVCFSPSRPLSLALSPSLSAHAAVPSAPHAEMQVQIFVGVVYYQRLRHMVSDKDQVRAKGPIQPLTRQPIHGRKVHGGIRLGEMERDALLAHGTAYIVQERLMHCSDEAKALVCARCGSLLAAMMRRGEGGRGKPSAHCLACGEGKGDVDVITIPYVFQYLTNELAAMNIKTQIGLKRFG